MNPYIVFSPSIRLYLALHVPRGDFKGYSSLRKVYAETYFTERGKRAILKAAEPQEFARLEHAKREAARLNAEHPGADFRVYANSPCFGIGEEVKNV